MTTKKVIGPTESLTRFFQATQFFQSRLGLVWLIDSSRKITDTCYEFTESENVKHVSIILQTVALASGCHIE